MRLSCQRSVSLALFFSLHRRSYRLDEDNTGDTKPLAVMFVFCLAFEKKQKNNLPTLLHHG